MYMYVHINAILNVLMYLWLNYSYNDGNDDCYNASIVIMIVIEDDNSTLEQISRERLSMLPIKLQYMPKSSPQITKILP